MGNNKLENLKEEYEKNPKDKNLLRYISCLIAYRNYDEALNLLEKVTDDTKMNIVYLYRAKIYRFKGNEEKFIENINKILSTDIAHEAYLELAEYTLSKMINLKKQIKTRQIEKNNETTKTIDNLTSTMRDYLEKSLNLNKTGNALLKYAELEFFLENYNEAKKLFEEILESNDLKIQLKDLYFVKLRLATIHINNGDLDSANKLIEEILNDKYPNKNKAFSLKAQILMKKGELLEAQKFYKKSLENFGSPDDYLEYAKLCISLAKNEEALEYLNKVKGTYLKNRAIQEEAKLNLNLGKYDEAINLYKKMLSGSYKDKNIAYIGIGSAYRILGKYKEAIEWLNKALSGSDHDKIMASIELAKLYEELNDHSKSEKLLDNVIKTSKGNYGRLEYARLLIKLHNHEEAKKLLLEILDNSSNKIDKQEALITLASLEKSSGNLIEAKNYIKGIKNLKNKTFYKALCIEIECNIELKEFDLARKNIDILKESQSKIDKEKTLFYEAEFLRAKGNLIEAENKYIELIKLNNCSVLALNSLAKIYKNTNNDKFFGVINKIRNISNNNAPLADYLEATYYVQSGNLKKALDLLHKNINSNNDYKEVSIILCAEIEEFCDNFNEAIDYYKMIDNKNSRYYNKAIFRIAKIYLKIGDLEKSEFYFKQIKDNNGSYKNLAEINLSIILSEKKEYDKATENLIKYNDTRQEGYAKLELAKIKIKQNKLEEANNILESIINTSSRFHVILELIKLKGKLKEYYEAIMYADVLIGESNGHIKKLAMLEKARIYSSIGEYKKARIICLDILFDIQNDDFDFEEDYIDNDRASRFKNNVLLVLGQSEKGLGNIEEATNYFLQINATKEKAYSYCELIDIEIERKNFDKALEYISMIENSFLADRAKIKKIGICLELGEYAKIHDICQEIKSDEYKELATYRNALAYFGEENFAKAKILFSQLIGEDRNFNDLSKMYLGKIAIIEKDFNTARKYFDSPDNYNLSKIRQLMFIDLKENKYYDALKKAMILYDYTNAFNEKEKDSIIISFLSSKLNIILPEKYYGKITKIKENALEYNKNDAYNYIIDKSINDNIFNPEVDFSLLLNIVETKLDDNHFIKNAGYDEYVFEFNNIGINGENYLKVCTLPNTKNIISMYPIKSRHDFHSEYVRKKARNEN